jgi:hypothetical protein
MTVEQLVAAARWLDELDQQLARAAATTWAILGAEGQGDEPGEEYVARSEEINQARAIQAQMREARRMLEERAEAVANRDNWPAGGSPHARAYALAKSLVDRADPGEVELELAELRAQFGGRPTA